MQLPLALTSPTIDASFAPDGDVLLALDAADIRAWSEGRGRKGHRARTSPLLDVSDPWRLKAVVRPNGARQVTLDMTSAEDFVPQDAQRRRVEIPLARGAPPDVPVVIDIDAHALLFGLQSGAGASTDRTLRRIRQPLRRGGPNPIMDALWIEGASAAFSDAAVGQQPVNLDGSIRDAWFVHAGVSAAFPVSIPEDAVLTLATGQIGEATLSVRVDGVAVPLAPPAAGWTPQRVDLSAWAGQDVSIALSARGEGIGLFGHPEVVSRSPREAQVPNVIVYLIDTLRADHLNAWGNPSDAVSPTVDRLVSEGVVFWSTVSASSWTKPAIPTVMSGLYPTTHQVGLRGVTDRLPEAVPTIQQALRDAGYRTASFSASPLGSTLSGLEVGFDLALTPDHWSGRFGPLGHPDAAQLRDALEGWVAEDPERPFFAYLHSLEAHEWRQPMYEDPPDGLTPYERAIQDADEKLGALVQVLASREDETLLVVLSDHGESFGDHGAGGHGTSLYHSQIHVPLVFWANQALPTAAIRDPVSLADVPNTILDLIGVPLLDADGVSLKAYFHGEQRTPIREGVPSHQIRTLWQPEGARWDAWVTADLRKALWVRGKRARMFDLDADLCERKTAPDNVDGAFEVLSDHLRAARTRSAAFDERYAPAAGALQGEEVERLKAMGYLE